MKRRKFIGGIASIPILSSFSTLSSADDEFELFGDDGEQLWSVSGTMNGINNEYIRYSDVSSDYFVYGTTSNELGTYTWGVIEYNGSNAELIYSKGIGDWIENVDLYGNRYASLQSDERCEVYDIEEDEILFGFDTHGAIVVDVESEHLYVVRESMSTLYKYDFDGNEIWETEPPDYGANTYTINQYEDTFVVTTENDFYDSYVVDAENGDILESFSYETRGSHQRGRYVFYGNRDSNDYPTVHKYDMVEQSFVWENQLDSTNTGLIVTLHSTDDLLYAGAAGSGYLYQMDPDTGEVFNSWETDGSSTYGESGTGVYNDSIGIRHNQGTTRIEATQYGRTIDLYLGEEGNVPTSEDNPKIQLIQDQNVIDSGELDIIITEPGTYRIEADADGYMSKSIEYDTSTNTSESIILEEQVSKNIV